MIRTGVFGSTGYTGYELIRLLAGHPEVELAFAASKSAAGSSLSEHFPRAPQIELISPGDAPLGEIDVVFLCMPHGKSAPWAVRALEAGASVVDLSADFRLKDPEVYQAWYGQAHPAPELLEEAVYGLTETARPQLAGARLVANPGCYPVSVLLALRPLADQLPASVIVDAKSGVSGAGRRPKLSTHFVEVADNLAPYNIGRSHRHVPEMEEQLSAWTASELELIFCPHLLPVPRGLLSTVYMNGDGALDPQAIHARYQGLYEDEPFVRLLPPGQPATLRHAVNSNLAVLGVTVVGRTVILTSAIDNLLKGASGQAVQNMNAMFGLAETCGLMGMGKEEGPCA